MCNFPGEEDLLHTREILKFQISNYMYIPNKILIIPSYHFFLDEPLGGSQLTFVICDTDLCLL